MAATKPLLVQHGHMTLEIDQPVCHCGKLATTYVKERRDGKIIARFSAFCTIHKCLRNGCSREGLDEVLWGKVGLVPTYHQCIECSTKPEPTGFERR